MPSTEVSLCQPAFPRESRVPVSPAEWITTPVPITSLCQSSFHVTFRSMPTGARLDLHISTCLESVLRKRDLANACLQEGIRQSSAQGLVSIWEVQTAAYNPLLRSSLPGSPGRCREMLPGTGLLLGLLLTQLVSRCLASAPCPKKQGNFYF